MPPELPNPGQRGPVEEHLDRRLSVALYKQAVCLIEPRRPLPAVAVGSDERDQALVHQPPEGLFGEGPVVSECGVAVRAQEATLLDERSRDPEADPAPRVPGGDDAAPARERSELVAPGYAASVSTSYAAIRSSRVKIVSLELRLGDQESVERVRSLSGRRRERRATVRRDSLCAGGER